MLITDHWNKDTVKFVAPYLQAARLAIRIATGYFTIQGYDLIRNPLENKRVYILVGYDEASRERLRDAVIENLIAHLRRWDVDNRRDAVRALVAKLQRRELEIVERRGEILEFIDSRVRNEDHTKVYIVDDDYVLVGSSNLSRSGLRLNAEGMSTIQEPERVGYWLERFETYWNDPNTLTLTDELLQALLQWLDLEDPFDIYLKTISALVSEEDIEAPRDSYKMPIQYQWVVISRTLRQLNDWGGAMLVASTGLGKTVMATHTALLLRDQKKSIRNVIVFSPKAVQLEWEEALDSAGLNYKVFVRDLLDQPASTDNRNAWEVDRILSALDRMDKQYLLIIDESHHYSNRFRPDNKERRSFERLVKAIAQKAPYVLLLTATPFTKDMGDINNQLYLLRHTAPPEYSPVSIQMPLAGFEETNDSWRLGDTEDFFDRFVDLPVCTVISTSQVAKNFAERTPNGDFVKFPNGRPGWIPRVYLRKIKAPVPLEQEITTALNGRFFEHKLKTFPHRGDWRGTTAMIETLARVSWSSSPLALREVVFNTIADGYDVTFIRSRKERQEHLAPILRKLDHWQYGDDAKFIELVSHIKQIHERGQKTIIFVERLPTALYLETGLQEFLPDVRVANTVFQTEAGGFESKSYDEVLELIIDFAPIANAEKRAERRKNVDDGSYYDVLISTDAYGVGMNLQDASNVISYDLAWTAAPIIQRAGRVLRFWHEPRDVGLYVFVPKLHISADYRRQVSDVEHRLMKLQRRTEVAEQFSELPMIPMGDSAEFSSLSGLANVEVEDIGLIDNTEIEEFTGVSPFLRHYQAYHDHFARAQALSDDLTSALYYDRAQPRLYLLMRYQGEFQWAVMTIGNGHLEDYKEDALLDMIACLPETEPAAVSADEIEVQAQRCKRLWCVHQGIQLPEEVERICALYLQPREPDGLSEMLRNGMEVR